jgi:peptide/nickel transport system substrate-binding protein
VAYGNSALIGFNWHPEDPVKKELFTNRDFKAGLSHAINRDEILDVVYQGEGTAWQLSPRAGGELYHEELATMHMEYSVDLANEFLDKTGYTEINSDGIREKPDGTPLAFTLEFTRAEGPEWPDVLELVQGYWREVGVDCTLKEQDRSINEERRSALLWDASIFVQFGGGPDINVFLDPRFYFPSHGNESAQLWATWYTSGGEDGEEPPDQVKRQMELFDQLLQMVDFDKQVELFREILDIAVEMFYGIGIMIADTTYAVVKNNFRNFPEGEMYFSWAYPTPGPANTCQFFKEGGGA